MTESDPSEETFADHVSRVRQPSTTAATDVSDAPAAKRSSMLSHLPRIADRVLLQGLRLRGYRSRYVETSVGSLHALEAQGAGELPPVVVLHGLSAAGQYYENVMRRIRPHVSRVVAPDLPGHGYSDLPEAGLSQDTLGVGLVEGLDALLTEPAILFGNSLGGIGAVRYAAQRPDKVLGLMLVAPGGAAMDAEALDEFVDGFRLSDHGKALDFVDRLFHRPPPMRHLLAWGVRQQFGRAGVDDLLRSITPADLLSPSELSALDMPVFVLWGEADRVLRPEHRRFYEQHLPEHAQMHRIEEYGHVPHMSHPDCLSARLLEFSRQVHGAHSR